MPTARHDTLLGPIAPLLNAAVLLFILPASCTPPAPSADAVYHNARVITMDDAAPEAAAMAVGGERILAIGSWEEMGPFLGEDTEVYDLQGGTIIPGINETHIHVRDLGFEQHYAVNLQPAGTVADVQDMLRRRLTELRDAGELGGWRYPTTGEEGEWLFGLGWTQDRLMGHRMATRHELDEVSREVPISLQRIYRGIAVNTRVFELLGIDFDDPATYPDWFRTDPPDFEAGDVILRDPATGLPNGVFLGDRAPRLVAAAIPSKSFQQRVESLALGLKVLASYGITAVVEAGSTLGAVTDVYEAAYREGRLPIRAVIYDGRFRSGDPEGLGDPERIAARLDSLGFSQQGDPMMRVRGAKSSADGGVGSRSAAVSVPYPPIPDDPLGGENYGALRDPDFDYRLAQFREIARRGWEIHTHACGDVAIRQTMDAYKILLDQLRRENPDADPRWSIIHDYLPDEPGTSVIQDMAEYGVIAAINPANLYFEGESFLRNLGPERTARHTPYRTFLDAGIIMASGSDYPNNSPDPWIGIYQMVTRKDQLTGRVHGPEQRISLLEALKTFTINGAYLTYDEEERGSLTPGKLADFVILEGDLLAASEQELLGMSLRVQMTVVGGRTVYRRDGFEAP
jgi:predicted amidohydrolase YtcJ